MKKLPLAKGLKLRQEGEAWGYTLPGLHRIFLTTADGERLSVRKLAKRAGLHESTIQRIKTGEGRPSLESGLKLARALGRSPWFILDYSKRVRKISKRRRKHGHLTAHR